MHHKKTLSTEYYLMTAGLSFPKTPIGCCSGCCIRRLTLTCSKTKATHKYSFPPDSTEVQETHRRRDRERKKVQKRWQWKVPQIKARDGKTREKFFFTDSKTFASVERKQRPAVWKKSRILKSSRIANLSHACHQVLQKYGHRG